jgi:hypothetical protein
MKLSVACLEAISIFCTESLLASAFRKFPQQAAGKTGRGTYELTEPVAKHMVLVRSRRPEMQLR